MPVMLSGMGADEIFAGYPRYLAYRISRSLDRIPRPAARASRATRLGRRPPGRPGRLRGPRRNLWKFMRGAGLPPAERYLAFSTYYTTTELGALLDSRLRRRPRGVRPARRPPGAVRSGRRQRRAEPAPLPRCQDFLTLPQPRLHRQDGDGRLCRGARAVTRRRAGHPGCTHSVGPQVERAERSTSSRRVKSECCRTTSSGGRRPASAHRSARGSSGPRAARARRALGGDACSAWHRRPADGGPADSRQRVRRCRQQPAALRSAHVGTVDADVSRSTLAVRRHPRRTRVTSLPQSRSVEDVVDEPCREVGAAIAELCKRHGLAVALCRRKNVFCALEASKQALLLEPTVDCRLRTGEDAERRNAEQRRLTRHRAAGADDEVGGTMSIASLDRYVGNDELR